jgi:hypothetical protein
LSPVRSAHFGAQAKSTDAGGLRPGRKALAARCTTKCGRELLRAND